MISLNAGQKYCRMLQGEHSAILSTSLSYQLLLRSLFCLFLSGGFTQVLLYVSFLKCPGFEKLKFVLFIDCGILRSCYLVRFHL